MAAGRARLPEPSRRPRKPKAVLCGTIAAYRRGCRCGQCRFASAMYHYDLRALKKELTEARASGMSIRNGRPDDRAWPKPPLRAGACQIRP